MENNSTNWTVGTTWYKWFFTDIQKMTILALSIFADIDIMASFSKYKEGMNTFEIFLVLFLFNIGTVLNIVTSIRDWRKEAAKLKNNA